MKEDEFTATADITSTLASQMFSKEGKVKLTPSAISHLQEVSDKLSTVTEDFLNGVDPDKPINIDQIAEITKVYVQNEIVSNPIIQSDVFGVVANSEKELKVEAVKQAILESKNNPGSSADSLIESINNELSLNIVDQINEIISEVEEKSEAFAEMVAEVVKPEKQRTLLEVIKKPKVVNNDVSQMDKLLESLVEKGKLDKLTVTCGAEELNINGVCEKKAICRDTEIYLELENRCQSLLELVPANDPFLLDGYVFQTPGNGEITKFNLAKNFLDLGESLIFEVEILNGSENLLTRVEGTHLELEAKRDLDNLAEIRIRAYEEHNKDLVIEDTFIINIFKANYAPYLFQTLPQLVVAEDSGDTQVPLGDYFKDFEHDRDKGLIFAVIGNDAPTKIKPTLVGDILTLSMLKDQHGTVSLTLRATDLKRPDLSIDDSLVIEIQSVNDAPIIAESCATSVNQDANYSCSPSVSDVDHEAGFSWSYGSGHTCAWLDTINSSTGAISASTPPTGSQVEECTVSLAVQDADGLPGETHRFSVNVINVVPRLSITSTQVDHTYYPTFSVQFNYNEIVSGFTTDDINVSNATLSNFRQEANPNNWSVDVTPLSNGSVTLSVNSNEVLDSSNTSNTASNTYTIDYTLLTPPATISVDEVLSTANIDSTTATPTVTVGGMIDDSIDALIYNNSSCSGTAFGRATASGTGVSVTLTTPLPSGIHKLYATSKKGEVESTCSTEFDTHVYSSEPFISVWRTTTDDETLTFPLRSGLNYDLYIDWGDGSSLDRITAYSDANRIHTYATAGDYTIKMIGLAEGLESVSASRNKLREVTSLGNMGWTNLSYAFYYCKSLTSIAGGETKDVTNMAYMFMEATSISSIDTSGWDTSKVTNMSNMFRKTSANPDVSSWDTSSVTTMENMFYENTSATPNVTNWNTGNVTNMQGLFRYASSAAPNVSSWNTSKVTNMNGVFGGVLSDNINISSWDISNVTDLSNMFYGSTNALPDVSSWNTSKVTNMSNLFRGAASANPNVSSWDISNVTNLQYMFFGATDATPDVSSWNTASVTNMYGVFRNATSANPDVDEWNTSNVTTMAYLFAGATSANPDIAGWDISNVTDLSYMFSGATSATPVVTTWNTASVTNMAGVFQNASAANPIVTNWNTANVTNMSYLFQGADSSNPDIDEWNTANVTNMIYMFYENDLADPDITAWDTNKVSNISFMFARASAATPDFSSWDCTVNTNASYLFAGNSGNQPTPTIATCSTSCITNMSYMFNGSTLNPNVADWNVSNVTNMQGMFSSTTNANPDVSGWVTSSVTNMASMFYNATAANPNVSSWNTGSVTTMDSMFRGNTVATPNVATWNTGNVTSFRRMFYGATQANPNVTDWNVDKVNDTSYMFSGAGSATPNLANWSCVVARNASFMFERSGGNQPDPVVSSFDTSCITNMSYMWRNSTLNPDVASWNTGNVTNMAYMWSGASSANPNVTNWNTANVTTMAYMWNGASNANPNVASWNTGNVNDMSYMWNGASLVNPDVSNWNVANVTSMSRMFQNATNANIDASSWVPTKVTNMVNMFNGVTLSTTNYSNLLIQLAAENTNENVSLNGGSSKYNSSATSARQTLVDRGWTITDGGLE